MISVCSHLASKHSFDVLGVKNVCTNIIFMISTILTKTVTLVLYVRYFSAFGTKNKTVHTTVYLCHKLWHSVLWLITLLNTGYCCVFFQIHWLLVMHTTLELCQHWSTDFCLCVCVCVCAEDCWITCFSVWISCICGFAVLEKIALLISQDHKSNHNTHLWTYS
jgi:hypothetical protein